MYPSKINTGRPGVRPLQGNTMLKKRIALLIALCLCLTACAPDTPAASDQDVRVVASFYPLYIAALNVVGDTPGVALSMMAPPDTGCLHDYQLRPQDMAALERCDLFILNGGGLESFLDDVLDKHPKLPLCTASAGVTFVPYEEGASHDEHDHDEHDHQDGDNPHAWVSVRLFIHYVENIRDGLIQADPAHKDAYERNAGRYIETLKALDADMRGALSDLPHGDIVTFHDAFSYFAAEFDLHVAAVIQREPGQDPSPSELADTIDIVRASGAAALFTEPQYKPAAAETIARETGVAVYTLDPAVTGELKADAYETAMRKNTQTLVEALS